MPERDVIETCKIGAYNRILFSVGACIFKKDDSFGWAYEGKSSKGFSTPEDAYDDVCAYIVGGVL